MKNTKIALATASALLLTTAFSNAQTTVGGNMRIGVKAASADLGGGLGSNSRMVKETQINIANKGKLNVGGLEYAAGFAVEFDGSDLNQTASAALASGKLHYENNHINIINPSTKTTLHFGADHLKPSDVQLSDIVGGPVRVDHVADRSAANASGTAVRSKYTHRMDDKGSNEGFGIGLIQEISNLGAFRFIYQHDSSEDASALADTGGDMTDALSSTTNSMYDWSLRGSLGVKGLDVLVSQNKQDGTGSARDIKFRSEGIRYTMGNVTGAYQQAKGDYSTTAGQTAKSKEYGLAYTVNPNLSVGAVLIKTKDDSATVEEKIKGLQIGYNLGPVLLSTVIAKIDDSNNTAGQDGKAIQLTLGTTF